MGEVWVAINDYPNYEISTEGKVKNKSTGKILKPIKATTGYMHIGLANEEGTKQFLLHRLMVETFMQDKKMDGLVVNHKDCDKTNNRLDNLELVTQKQNILHSKINGKQIRKIGEENKLSKTVYQYSLDKKLIKIWRSVMDIEREIGIKSNSVSNCALGKCKSAKGYIWSYVELSA